MRRNLVLLLALVLPTLVYWALVKSELRRAGGEERRPWWVEAPWPKLAVATVLLLGAMLLTMTLLSSAAGPLGAYQPARMENGEVVPGQMLAPGGK